jgi:hypothetical protein
VTAFYNEIDPYCAQWLRNLIDAGHIAPGVVDERSIEDITRAGQARPVCSSFGQEADDMSGKEPRPFPARPCSPQPAAGLGAGVLACEQSPSRAVRRRIRRREERRGSRRRSVDSGYQAASSSSFAPDRLLPLPVCARERFALTARWRHADTRPNKATCCAAPARPESALRTAGSCGPRSPAAMGSPCGKRPCKRQSNIFCGSEIRASKCRSARMKVAFPSPKTTTSYGGSP